MSTRCFRNVASKDNTNKFPNCVCWILCQTWLVLVDIEASKESSNWQLWRRVAPLTFIPRDFREPNEFEKNPCWRWHIRWSLTASTMLMHHLLTSSPGATCRQNVSSARIRALWASVLNYHSADAGSGGSNDTNRYQQQQQHSATSVNHHIERKLHSSRFTSLS